MQLRYFNYQRHIHFYLHFYVVIFEMINLICRFFTKLKFTEKPPFPYSSYERTHPLSANVICNFQQTLVFVYLITPLLMIFQERILKVLPNTLICGKSHRILDYKYFFPDRSTLALF